MRKAIKGLRLSILAIMLAVGFCGLSSLVHNAYAAPSSAGYLWPLKVKGTFIQGFSSTHYGIDIGVPVNTEVVASCDGVVKYVQKWNGVKTKGDMNSYGNLVIIYHPSKGTATYYAHLNSYCVSKGQAVTQGTLIGKSGNTGNSTGPHLHFEMKGKANPNLGTYGKSDGASVNPYNYVSNANIGVHTHNYSNVIKTVYSYSQGSGGKHNVTKTYQCSCKNTTTKTTLEACTYSNGRCMKCGITKTTPYAFKPMTIEEGVYSIRIGKNSAYTIDITGGSINGGANAQLYRYDGAGAQLFSFVKNDDGSYWIINIKSGKALATQAWNKEIGGNICQESWIIGHANKCWYIGQLSDGTYILKNKHSGLYLECEGGAVANGANIQQYSGNFENNNFKNAQKWTLVKSSIMDTSITGLGAGENIISTFWKKQQNYNDGFQIRYATKRDMSDALVITEPYYASLGKSVSGFKPGTTYYVQVRTYKHPSGSNGWFHSAWSAAQTVKTTKAKDTTNQVVIPSSSTATNGSIENALVPNASTQKPIKATTKATLITKLSAGKKSFTVKWKARQKHATGYQVSWSTDKKFKKGVKSKLVKGAKKTTLKVSKLKGGKKYYVKVRVYKQVNGIKYYSSWSKVKTVKTKK